MQTIFITGTTDGVGKLAAIGLAKSDKESTILIHGRNKDKLNEVIDEFKHQTGNQNIKGYVADFSALDEVRQLAKDILSSIIL
jgi:short-subunit dehydrogenase